MSRNKKNKDSEIKKSLKTTGNSTNIDAINALYNKSYKKHNNNKS